MELFLASKNRKDRNKVKEELLIKAEDILSKLISKAQQNNDELIIGTMLTLQALVNDLKKRFRSLVFYLKRVNSI